MNSPVCIRCHRPLRSAESIARGYGNECYKKVNDDIHAGLHSLSMLCYEMNIQANCTALLPEIPVKQYTKNDREYFGIEQLSLIDELFENAN